MEVHGIMGAAGAGKDTTAAGIIAEAPDFIALAFADPMKLGASVTFGIPIEHFYDREVKEVDDPFWGISPRVICQKYGQMMRELFSEDFWIRRMDGMIKMHNLQKIVVTDVRYENEVDYVKSLGGKILGVVRDDLEEVASHSSEELAARVLQVADHIFTNNGSIEELHASVKEYLNE